MNKKSIRESLLKELARLSGRSERIEQHWREAPPSDWAELAIHRENDEVVGALDEMAKREIEEIKVAIQRIDDGEWEECTACGEMINPARLQALPTTTLCVACAEKLEHS